MIGYKSWAIPEGNVVKVTDESGAVIWALPANDKPAILQVEKITANTYASETQYTSESFVCLNIYPKSANSKVNVTYGGLTKTLQFNGTNAQQVFFGTLYGESDSVSTPENGTLTIEGDYKNFAVGTYNTYSSITSKSQTNYCSCITAVNDWGSIKDIANYAFHYCNNLTIISLPSGIISIGDYAFSHSKITSIHIPDTVTSIGKGAFESCYELFDVFISKGVSSIGVEAFHNIAYDTLTTKELTFVVDSENNHFSYDGGVLFNKNKSILYDAISLEENYTIPDTVTSIGEYAFQAEAPGSVVIPASVTSIGNRAFSCSSTIGRTVYMLSATPPILGGDSVFHDLGSNNIVVPVGSGNTYKTAEYWSKYSDYITEAS